MFTGCQQRVLIDLLNESGFPILVINLSHGHPMERMVENHDRLLVLSPDPLTILEHGQERRYTFPIVPQEFIRSRFSGRVISIKLGSDQKLYVLRTDKAAPTDTVPQPEKFPILPNK
ncbi:MAG: hypothetical protein JWQ04_1553 [Pedosphaera sp.]|nr:hypothetical protein [Pedosphaera sp.]